jgi:hypothetical protein
VTVAAIVAFGVFALIFTWLGMVLGATWRTMQEEARDAGLVRDRPVPPFGGLTPESEHPVELQPDRKSPPPRSRPG